MSMLNHIIICCIVLRYVMSYSTLHTTRLCHTTSQLLTVASHQVYHLCRNNQRYLHERANNTYSVTAAFCADLTTTAIGLLAYIPGVAVAYFMMGYPREAFPFVMCVYYVVSIM